MYLILSCLTLSNISYISRVKWSNSGKGLAPSPTPRCSSYWKASFLITLDYGRQLYFFTKYIYIYVCVCVCVCVALWFLGWVSFKAAMDGFAELAWHYSKATRQIGSKHSLGIDDFKTTRTCLMVDVHSTQAIFLEASGYCFMQKN